MEDKEFDEKAEKIYEEANANKTVTLSELSTYLFAFGNDVRIMHLYTSGLEFMPYHEKLNELYDVCYDAYDKTAELAISHGEKIENPTKAVEGWEPVEGDKFTAKDICDKVIEKGNKVLGIIENVKDYESFVQSEIDDFTSKIDKIVNYIFTQSAE